MKIYILILIISSVTGMHSAYANCDIETTKANIIRILQQRDRTSIPQFYNFFHRYDTLVANLFDIQNKDSLQTHIARMEMELSVLQQTVHDPKYRPIKQNLESLQNDLVEMTQLLKENSNAYAHTLGPKLQRYGHLLPSTIKQRGLWSLYCSLQHRLNCKD